MRCPAELFDLGDGEIAECVRCADEDARKARGDHSPRCSPGCRITTPIRGVNPGGWSWEQVRDCHPKAITHADDCEFPKWAAEQGE